MPQKTTKAGVSFSNSNKSPVEQAVGALPSFDMQGKRHGWSKLLSRIAPSLLHLLSLRAFPSYHHLITS